MNTKDILSSLIQTDKRESILEKALQNLDKKIQSKGFILPGLSDPRFQCIKYANDPNGLLHYAFDGEVFLIMSDISLAKNNSHHIYFDNDTSTFKTEFYYWMPDNE